MNGVNIQIVKHVAETIQQDLALGMTSWNAHVAWTNGVKNEVSLRDFPVFCADEPERLGGTDTGANPVEYLLGAIGSCFAITFEVLASLSGIQLEEVAADVSADLNAAVFLGVAEGYGGIMNPLVKLKVVSSASREQIEQIAQIALEKSPVLASLKETVRIEIA